MIAHIKRTKKEYSLAFMAFKLAVVTEIEAEAMTDKQAQRPYGIQGRSTVLVWLKKYGVLNWKTGAPKIMRLDIMYKPIEKHLSKKSKS